MDQRIVILGGGPTGLGAAWRLTELQYPAYRMFEKNPYPGGLSSSHTDENGFTWDIGGHVLFSHYPYFDRLMDLLLKDRWLSHERESWVWMRRRWIPYPFQFHIGRLPTGDLWRCLWGMVASRRNGVPPRNFKQWIYSHFGKGIAELFMLPYNEKVWAYPAEEMSFSWIGERVAVPDFKRVASSVLLGRDDASWGPNNTFRFPEKGGTGEIWKQLCNRLDREKVFLNSPVRAIDTRKREVLVNGQREPYDILISTLPLDQFLTISDLRDASVERELVHTSVHLFGIGLKGAFPETLKRKCWIYFPERHFPFHRATVFSNYSPNNVPDVRENWSLMLEVSESPRKPVNRGTLKEEVIRGAVAAQLVPAGAEIVDIWERFERYGYPVPSLGRDAGTAILKTLEDKGIYSRGRFGAWRYEAGNMDHSLMQGVEAVNRILFGEEEKTLRHPEAVNRGSGYA